MLPNLSNLPIIFIYQLGVIVEHPLEERRTFQSGGAPNTHADDGKSCAR
jgi:hypothetical protein